MDIEPITTDDIFIGKTQIKPITILGYDYAEYNFSDIILIPMKYYDQIYSKNSELNVLKLKCNDVETYGTVFNIVEGDCIYVSITIFQYFKNNKVNVYTTPFDIYLCNNRLIKQDLVILEPINIEFFDIKNQLELFKNYIGDKYRVLYNNMILSVYSQEIKKDLIFIVKLDENLLLPAINMDLKIDFQPKEELVTTFENKQKEEKEKCEKMLNFIDNCRGVISTKTEEEPITREEIRKRRLAFFKKN